MTSSSISYEYLKLLAYFDVSAFVLMPFIYICSSFLDRRRVISIREHIHSAIMQEFIYLEELLAKEAFGKIELVMVGDVHTECTYRLELNGVLIVECIIRWNEPPAPPETVAKLYLRMPGYLPTGLFYEQSDWSNNLIPLLKKIGHCVQSHLDLNT